MTIKTTTSSFEYNEEAGDFRFKFGKHEGEWLGQVALKDTGYLSWMYFEADFSPIDKQIIEEVCEDLDVDLEE